MKMAFEHMLKQVQEEDRLAQQNAENAHNNLVEHICVSITHNADQLYQSWSKQLAQAILHEKKKTIRIPFPSIIPLYPDVEYKGPKENLESLNLILVDPTNSEVVFPTHLRIVLISRGREYKKTNHYYSFLDHIRNLAKSDNILVSDVICEEHSWESSLAGSRNHKTKDVALSDANDYKRSTFNKYKSFSYQLFIELTYQG